MGVYKLYKLPLSFVYDGITANQIMLSPMTPGVNSLWIPKNNWTWIGSPNLKGSENLCFCL